MAFEAGKMIRIKSSSTLVRRDPSTANPYWQILQRKHVSVCRHFWQLD